MKRRVFDYIKEHPCVRRSQIAAALGEKDLDVQHAIHVLCKDGFIMLCSPIPLSEVNDDSCRFKAIKNKYSEH